ncbi:MAG: hypothetical protein HY323_00400, partial [Betaproteobacteria bacterium]|nr:hypothetical protein [Betaproteobacteria bacterium]
MAADAKKLLLCDCNKTMPLDGRSVAAALGLETPPVVNSELCRRHLASFEGVVKSGADMVVACTQEAALFRELHGELKGSGNVRFTNIRETAGWSHDANQAAPKIAALLALAALPEAEPVPAVSYKAEGKLLIIGQASVALQWAERLGE